MLLALSAGAFAADLHVKIVPISDGQQTAQGYALGEINAVSFRINAILTAGNQQFASFYGPEKATNATDHKATVVIARRQLGSAKWELFQTHFTANRINDAHDSISIAIDGSGFMHLGWGMHADAFHYARTTGPVMGSAPIEFGPDESMTGLEKTRITYPEFYNMPNGDLLFFARQGVAGNGDLFINRYSVNDQKWTRVQSPVIRGTFPKWDPANAYWNNLCFDSKGGLVCTWGWRSNQIPGGEIGYETNHDLNYARSPDEGKTWDRFDGTPYTLPITQQSCDVVVHIPQGCCLMNQSSMAIDANDHPVIANWWAPDAARGKYGREYMLAYYDGEQWQTSQVSQRNSPELKRPEQEVRDLARPIVVIDKQGRVIVMMSYVEKGHHIMVAYSKDRKNWKYLTLDTTDMGKWEPPAYDMTLWQRENKLDVLYEPCGLGKPSADMSVLEWDEHAFFADK
jgi:BNR repeat-containing family member